MSTSRPSESVDFNAGALQTPSVAVAQEGRRNVTVKDVLDLSGFLPLAGASSVPRSRGPCFEVTADKFIGAFSQHLKRQGRFGALTAAGSPLSAEL